MATGKRYYWIKLKDTFFNDDGPADFLMSQTDGANYVVLYQMLCLKTINTNGRLSNQIGEVIIPYDIEKIRRTCKYFSADTIRIALNLYKALGLIYEDVNGTLTISDHDNMVGSETDWAAKKRRQMAGNNPPELPQPCGDDTGDDCGDVSGETGGENFPIEIRDKEIKRLRDKDLNLNISKKEKKQKKKGPCEDETASPDVSTASGTDVIPPKEGKFSENSDAYQAASYLARQKVKNYPNLKSPSEEDIQRWANDIDKCNRIDGYSWDDIADVLHFSQKSKFWRQNIRSGAKFREQYERLLIQMTEEEKSRNGRR